MVVVGAAVVVVAVVVVVVAAVVVVGAAVVVVVVVAGRVVVVVDVDVVVVDVDVVVVALVVVVVDVEVDVVVVGLLVVVVDVEVDVVVVGLVVVVVVVDVGTTEDVVEVVTAAFVAAAFVVGTLVVVGRADAGSGERSPRHPPAVHTTEKLRPDRNEKIARVVSPATGATLRTLRGAAVTKRPGYSEYSADPLGETPYTRRPSSSRRPSVHRRSPFVSQLVTQSGTADAAAATRAIRSRPSPI